MRILLALSISALAGCAPADSGSRNKGAAPGNAFPVRSLTVIPPPDATKLELAWIKETTEESLKLLDAIPLATRLKLRLRVHRTLRDWQDAYRLVRNPRASNDPVIWQPRRVMVPPLSQQLFVGPVGEAFLSGVNGSATLHVIAGTWFEIPSLGHHLLHVHLPALGVASHVYGEPIWARLDYAAWQLSTRLALQR